jgi:hypothetical protein
MKLARSKSQINSALKRAGIPLEIQNNRGGYSYFTDMEGNQVGESVMVCYLSQISVGAWIAEA